MCNRGETQSGTSLRSCGFVTWYVPAVSRAHAAKAVGAAAGGAGSPGSAGGVQVLPL